MEKQNIKEYLLDWNNRMLNLKLKISKNNGFMTLPMLYEIIDLISDFNIKITELGTGVEGTINDAESIRDALQTLIGEERLSASAIKDISENTTVNYNGEPTSLQRFVDKIDEDIKSISSESYVMVNGQYRPLEDVIKEIYDTFQDEDKRGLNRTEIYELLPKTTSELINDGSDGINPFIDKSQLDDSISKLYNRGRIIYDNGFKIDQDNTVFIYRGLKWSINGKEYTYRKDLKFNIDTSVEGRRLDLIVCDDNNGLRYIIGSGVDNETKPTPPTIGENELIYLYVYIEDGVYELIAFDRYFQSNLKENWFKSFIVNRIVNVTPYVTSIEIVGSNDYMNNKFTNVIFGVEANNIYDGMEISILNSRTDYCTISHNAHIDAPIPFFLYTHQDYYLRPNETIVFKFQQDRNVFVVKGGLDIRKLTEQDIGDIIGNDSLTLFIDSSEGEFLDYSNPRTLLTPYVDKYFKDYTDKVTRWQWFRESGDTQEDRDSDEIWSQDKTSRLLLITEDDLTEKIYNNSVTFICQAIIESEIIQGTLKFN